MHARFAASAATALFGLFLLPPIPGSRATATDATPTPSTLGTRSQPNDNLLSDVKVPPDFEATVFAAPTNVSYPTCIAATPRGEVFVGVDQNGSLDTRPGRGWVVRCLDTDGDGVADRFNVFARMDSPRGIVFDHHTLFVMHPPVVEAFYDDDGDGVADRSEILVRGLAHDLKFRGADHTCNGMRLGIDGWLYIAHGDYGALHAVANDGSELQLHGGGIVRVRPDGTELELVVQGTRNIYDVAVDPLLNLFTCDNTNDGDDWNVRLSHMIPTANYGYPSLFRHFSDEMIQTMADYGGGSPTGILFLAEPGFPDGFGHGLYTCQWGWSTVNRHPLTAQGASFQAQRDAFIQIPRPTGIDEDGEGHLYVASWKGATFTYNGPQAGFVVRVTPRANRSTQFPDLQRATNDELLQDLASPSAVWRLNVQREILRRGDRPGFAPGLEQLALTHGDLAVRVAAMFTLKQLLGAGAQPTLLRLAHLDPLREFALRALADRKGEAATVPTRVFTAALADRDPRVRLQAVIALNRLGRREAAERLLRLTADPDPAIAHVAFRALVSFHAFEACFKALDETKLQLLPGAMRALRNLHDAGVVDGLVLRLGRTQTSSTRQLILQALCRLYYREADWDGSWWGTRPDTSGPYYKPVTWDQTAKIGRALRDTLLNADAETIRYLLGELGRHKIDSPELSPLLVSLAARNPDLRAPVVELLTQRPALPPASIPFLQSAALATSADPALRTRAFDGLERAADQPEAIAAAVQVLIALGKTESVSPAFTRMRDEFMHDRRHARNTTYFVKLAAAEDPAERELAYAVLLQVATARNTPAQASQEARQLIDQVWSTQEVPRLLRAIGETRAAAYADRVRGYVKDARPQVAAAATYAASQLAPVNPVAGGPRRRNVIGNLPFARVAAEAAQTPGDPQQGAQLFQTLGCVKCHTTTKSEPLKGPFLGDIAARYHRPEIIESILRPNAQIAQGFVTTWVQTKDGEEYDGFVVHESGDRIELRNLAGATVIAKKDIAERGTRTTSIMPEGLADQLTTKDLASLLAYLESLKGR